MSDKKKDKSLTDAVGDFVEDMKEKTQGVLGNEGKKSRDDDEDEDDEDKKNKNKSRDDDEEDDDEEDDED